MSMYHGKTFKYVWALLILLTAVVQFVRAEGSTVEYFVSTVGSDTNQGTENRPFATLERATQAVREHSQGNGAVVYIRGGRYILKNRWELGSADSGKSDSPVVYRAFPGENVEISGNRYFSLEQVMPVKDPEILGRIIDPEAREYLHELDLSGINMGALGRISRQGYRLHRSSWKYGNDINNILSQKPESRLFIDGQRQTLAMTNPTMC